MEGKEKSKRELLKNLCAGCDKSTGCHMCGTWEEFRRMEINNLNTDDGKKE